MFVRAANTEVQIQARWQAVFVAGGKRSLIVSLVVKRCVRRPLRREYQLNRDRSEGLERRRCEEKRG